MIVQNCKNQDWTRKLLFHIAVSCRRRFRHFNSFPDHHYWLANNLRYVTVNPFTLGHALHILAFGILVKLATTNFQGLSRAFKENQRLSRDVKEFPGISRTFKDFKENQRRVKEKSEKNQRRINEESTNHATYISDVVFFYNIQNLIFDM